MKLAAESPLTIESLNKGIKKIEDPFTEKQVCLYCLEQFWMSADCGLVKTGVFLMCVAKIKIAKLVTPAVGECAS